MQSTWHRAGSCRRIWNRHCWIARSCGSARSTQVPERHSTAGEAPATRQISTTSSPPGREVLFLCPPRMMTSLPCSTLPARPPIPRESCSLTANLMGEVQAVFGWAQIGPEDAVLGVLPLFHVLSQMANLLLPLVKGARVVYLETLNTTELLRALAEREDHGVRGRAAVLLLDSRAHLQGGVAAWQAGRLGRANDDDNHSLQPEIRMESWPDYFSGRSIIFSAAKCGIW